jgi:hypothetical protein
VRHDIYIYDIRRQRVKKTQTPEAKWRTKMDKGKEMCESVDRNFLTQNRVHWWSFYEYDNEPWGN